MTSPLAPPPQIVPPADGEWILHLPVCGPLSLEDTRGLEPLSVDLGAA